MQNTCTLRIALMTALTMTACDAPVRTEASPSIIEVEELAQLQEILFADPQEVIDFLADPRLYFERYGLHLGETQLIAIQNVVRRYGEEHDIDEPKVDFRQLSEDCTTNGGSIPQWYYDLAAAILDALRSL